MADVAIPEAGVTGGAAEKQAPETGFSPLKSLWNIIIHPIKTFERLREAPRSFWWVVLLVTLVTLGLLTGASVGAQEATLAAFRAQAAASGRQFGGNFQGTSPVLSIALPLAGGLAVILLDYLLRAAVMFVSSLVLGGQATFKQAFRAGVWSTVPYAVKNVVQVLAVALTGGQVAAGLSAALTTAEIRALPLLNTLLSHLDFYVLWSAALLWVGTMVTARMGKGKSVVAVIAYVGLALVGILLYFVVENALFGRGGLFNSRGAGARTPAPGG